MKVIVLVKEVPDTYGDRVLDLETGLADREASERVLDEVEADHPGLTVARLRTALVFQADAVFPWRNVIDNVAAGPMFRGTPHKQAHELAAQWITRVGLEGFARHYPHQLSGGMRKRVALAQTFINNPEILLMDEPFSALDMQTRTLMQDELLKLWSERGGSVVFVTHDIEEAIALADRVFVLSARPATLKRVYPIDLPRPRVMAEVRYHPNFIELSKRIWSDLREEVSIH